MRDLYEILEVERNASYSDIKSSYRKLAKKYHPDLNQGDEEASEKFKEINLAYEVLSDEQKRAHYDQYGDSIFEGGGNPGAGFGGFEDIFGSIFSDFFGGGTSYSSGPKGKRAYRGADLEETVTLDFMEAIKGKKVSIQVRVKETCDHCKGDGAEPGSKKHTCEKCHGTGEIRYAQNSPFGQIVRSQTCPDCQGTGEIIDEPCKECKGKGYKVKSKKIDLNVTPGVDNGTILRLSGKGDAGVNGGPNGDLYVHVRVKEHEFFKRDNLDIYYDYPIRFSQAVLGDTIEVPTLDGVKEFELPKGTESGTTFTLQGEGVQSPRGSRKGNIYFRTNIITPKKISERQEELLREFDQLEGNQQAKGKKNIFEKVKDIFD